MRWVPAMCVAALLAVGTMAPVASAASDVVLPGGALRVQALSPTLLRVEPKGPMGFENRTTFMVVDRSFDGVDLTVVAANATHASLKTAFYNVELTYPTPGPPSPPGPPPMCDGKCNTDVTDGSRISTCQDLSKPCLAGVTQSQCCGNCSTNTECNVWVYSPSSSDCWMLTDAAGTRPAIDRCVGGDVSPPTPATGVSVTVTSPSGSTLWSISDLSNVDQNLNWPAPTTETSYAIKDYPRFYAPEWGPTPMPADAKVDPALEATNGYDFRNDVSGDAYIFLLGDSLDDWFAARRTFIKLAGPTPLLPDYAYGTWFTYWHQYTEAEAKGEVERWQSDQLPLDIWALDMNWRDTPHGAQPGYQTGWNHLYNHPNTQLFPDFANNGTGWFDWLMSKGLRTYFNDHPFPTDGGKAYQTTHDEVEFRWAGLSHWMEKGLTFWWFDANWKFSIPPPNVPYSGAGDGPSWQGMDNRVWGSHLYYTTVEVYNKNNPKRQHTAPAERPMVLTKYADGNMHPGLVQHQHPAQHRYPVWWTGDGVSLEASVESMVDSGVYDFKPFVHSDCGGDYRPKFGGDLLRWAAHCVFGTILRFHGNEHQPWSYDTHIEDTIRSYLNMRYKMIPTLIAAGQVSTQTSFPIVARCDLYWPQHPEAASNHQYIHLNNTLIAPIWDSSQNITTRDVWVPPGDWQDAWSGAIVTGPKNITVSLGVEQIPMWHKKGAVTVITSDPGLRVDAQDWSELTLETFPAETATTAKTALYARHSGTPRTDITMFSDATQVNITVSEAEDGEPRAWVVRVHLPLGATAENIMVDGVAAEATHLEPVDVVSAEDFAPFGGKGARPAPLAGLVAEVALPRAGHVRFVSLKLSR